MHRSLPALGKWAHGGTLMLQNLQAVPGSSLLTVSLDTAGKIPRPELYVHVPILCLSFLVFTELIPRPVFEAPTVCQALFDSASPPPPATVLEKLEVVTPIHRQEVEASKAETCTPSSQALLGATPGSSPAISDAPVSFQD